MRLLLSWVLAAIVICAIVAGYYYYYRVDEEVRRHVQRMLAEQYPDYSVVVGSARLVQGEGIRLREVSIARPAGPEMKQRSVLLFCDEVLLKCNPSLQQLLQGRTDVPHVRLRGLVLRPLREPDGSWNVEDLIALRIADRPMPTVTIDDAHVEVVDRRLSPPSILTLDNLSLTMIPRSSEVPLQDDEATASRGGPHAVAIRANFTNEHCREVLVRGWVNPETLAWSLEGTVADLRFTPELLRALPAEAWPRLASFSGLRAHANLGFTVNLDPTAKNGPRFAIEGQLIDGRLESIRHLATPVTEMTAISVRCDNDGWQVKDLKARYGAARITLSAKSQKSISDDALTLRGTVQNLNITPELIATLPQPFQAQWRKFKPLGLVDAGFQAVRQRGRWWLATDTQFRSVSLICEKFKYPLVRAHGTVTFRQNEALVADLWASADQMSDQTPIHLTANIRRPGPNFQGDIYVTSHDWLPLNKSLTSPLAPVVQRILGDLEAQGHIKFDAHLRRDEHGKFHKDITIDVEKGWLRHKSFPYPLDHVHRTRTGQVALIASDATRRTITGRRAVGIARARGTGTAAGVQRCV